MIKTFHSKKDDLFTKKKISPKHKQTLPHQIRVAIGCTVLAYSEAIAYFLKSYRNIKVVKIFRRDGDIFSNIKDILKYKPDILITDFDSEVDLRNKLFFSSFNYKKDQKVKMLLLGDKSYNKIHPLYLKELYLRGVVGILPPNIDADSFIEAIIEAFNGNLCFNRDLLLKLRLMDDNKEDFITLTEREKEIISLICRGLKNKEISQDLKISEQTVKIHCSNIYKKLGVSSRLKLILHSTNLFKQNLP